jgi:hypothetical protein
MYKFASLMSTCGNYFMCSIICDLEGVALRHAALVKPLIRHRCLQENDAGLHQEMILGYLRQIKVRSLLVHFKNNLSLNYLNDLK